MHGAQILPRSTFARPCERKARGAGYRKCTSHCGRRPHPPHDRARLPQTCAIMGGWGSVAGGATHDRQCCGERTVRHCVCASCPAASALPQRVSCQRHPPARSNFRCWRFSAAARPMTAACPHGASCSTAAARTSTVGGALPSTQHKKRPAFRWPFFRGYELSADYSARSFRRRSSSSAS